MNKYFLMFIVIFNFWIHSVDTSTSTPVEGEVYLYLDTPLFAGSDTKYFKKAFNLDIKSSDILAKINFSSRNSQSYDLSKREKEFLNLFDRGFKRFLPLSLFKDKTDENEINLIFYGRPVKLTCKAIVNDIQLREKGIETFADGYFYLLKSIAKKPNFMTSDASLLVKAGVLNYLEEECSYGLIGYLALLNCCPQNKYVELYHISTNHLTSKLALKPELNEIKAVMEFMKTLIEKQQTIINNNSKLIHDLFSVLPK